MNKDWWSRPAYWWEFWLPQSGPIGGMIFGGLIIVITILLARVQ